MKSSKGYWGLCLESMEMKRSPYTMLKANALTILLGAQVLFQEEMMEL